MKHRIRSVKEGLEVPNTSSPAISIFGFARQLQRLLLFEHPIRQTVLYKAFVHSPLPTEYADMQFTSLIAYLALVASLVAAVPHPELEK